MGNSNSNDSMSECIDNILKESEPNIMDKMIYKNIKDTYGSSAKAYFIATSMCQGVDLRKKKFLGSPISSETDTETETETDTTTTCRVNSDNSVVNMLMNAAVNSADVDTTNYIEIMYDVKNAFTGEVMQKIDRFAVGNGCKSHKCGPNCPCILNIGSENLAPSKNNLPHKKNNAFEYSKHPIPNNINKAKNNHVGEQKMRLLDTEDEKTIQNTKHQNNRIDTDASSDTSVKSSDIPADEGKKKKCRDLFNEFLSSRYGDEYMKVDGNMKGGNRDFSSVTETEQSYGSDSDDQSYGSDSDDQERISGVDTEDIYDAQRRLLRATKKKEQMKNKKNAQDELSPSSISTAEIYRQQSRLFGGSDYMTESSDIFFSRTNGSVTETETVVSSSVFNTDDVDDAITHVNNKKKMGRNYRKTLDDTESDAIRRVGIY